MIKLENVTQVYTGAHGCMCGCKGKYRAAIAHADFVARDRGHALSKDEISDRSVKVVLGKILRGDFRVDLFRDGSGCVYTETPTRVNVAYFRDTVLFEDMDPVTLALEV